MTRYAVYYVPEATSGFYRAASELLGRCIYTGNALSQPLMRNFDLEALTVAPRRYGLHATLKAPFNINCTEEQLLEAFQGFCMVQVPARVDALSLELMGGGFFAITGYMSPELIKLEERCVKLFQPYASLLTKKEVIRRGAQSSKELLYLKDWGYHKIFDLFRFHITLTDYVPGPDRAKVAHMLNRHLKIYLDRPLLINSLALCRQTAAHGPFTVLAKKSFITAETLNINPATAFRAVA